MDALFSNCNVFRQPTLYSSLCIVYRPTKVSLHVLYVSYILSYVSMYRYRSRGLHIYIILIDRFTCACIGRHTYVPAYIKAEKLGVMKSIRGDVGNSFQTQCGSFLPINLLRACAESISFRPSVP